MMVMEDLDTKVLVVRDAEARVLRVLHEIEEPFFILEACYSCLHLGVVGSFLKFLEDGAKVRVLPISFSDVCLTFF
jgi:hypothetical protein